MFDNRSNETYTLEKHTRFLQICSPNLNPIIVSIVDNVAELGTTERGQGGFGSTGV
jgi:dUTPase